jgi:hypothetical protein
MELTGIAIYVVVLALSGAIFLIARTARVPLSVAAIVTGLLLGRGGFELVPHSWLARTLPGVTLHVAFLLGVVGYRLGAGMLRLPFVTVLRRSLPPLALAVVSLGVALVAVPLLLPGAEPQRSYVRFYLPLAVVVGAYPLLALRDLRGRPPADVGSLFLVAVLLVGAVYSFAPQLVWSPDLDIGVVWRGPLLVLGESGALGFGVGVLYLLLVRRLRLPAWLAALLVLTALAIFAFRFRLWLPFSGLGFGMALGRVREPGPRLRLASPLYSEAPFLLLVAAAFAPDLFLESLVKPAALHAAGLVVLLLAVRRWVRGGRELVTGPGLLFLGLTLTVRLDGRMGPLTRYTVDLALPAWVLLRLLVRVIEIRARQPRPTTKIISSALVS